MTAALSARPLGMAEIIDRSLAVGRRHFRALFVAMLLVGVPALLLGRAMPDARELLGASRDPDRTARALGEAAQRLGWILLALVALQLLSTAIAAWLVEPTLDPRRGASRPRPGRRVWAMLTATAAQVALIAIAPAVGALPGAALAVRGYQAASLPTWIAGLAGAFLGGVGLLFVVTLRLMLAPAAAALEGRAGISALARSSRLMAPRPGTRFGERPAVRASLVLLALLVLTMAIGGAAGIPRLVAQRLVQGAGAPAGPPGLSIFTGHLPLALDLLVTAIEAMLGAALQPFSVVPVVVFYFDRRARTEALDAELWAEALEER